MGMTSEARAKRDAEIAALAPADHAPTEPAKERGHGRGKTVLHNARGQHPELRGVPLVGTGQGAIAGTVPGPGASGAALEQEALDLSEHARMIVAARMKAARKRLRQPGDQT